MIQHSSLTTCDGFVMVAWEPVRVTRVIKHNDQTLAEVNEMVNKLYVQSISQKGKVSICIQLVSMSNFGFSLRISCHFLKYVERLSLKNGFFYFSP